jgi:DNA-binding MurR/RpiR family transcriptional regulator
LTLCAGRRRLDEAAAAIRRVRHVYLTGIGSSWHAALSAESLFPLGGCAVYMQDAAELLQFATFPPDAVLIVISHSGRSVEIAVPLAVEFLRSCHDVAARTLGGEHDRSG